MKETRLIDANAPKATYEKWLAQLESHEDVGDRNGVITCIAALEDAPTIEAEPVRHGRWADEENNEPLTLEELREMDGEPIWFRPAKPGGVIQERWMLQAGYIEEQDLYLFHPSSGIAQGYNGAYYGKTWLAYRHKPLEHSEV